MNYKLTIPGEPVAKGRPRVYRVNGLTRTFTPERTVRYEQHVRNCAMLASFNPLVGPVRVCITANWACPASAARRKTPLLRQWRTKKPDADNVAKLICDALNGIAYADDSQVVLLDVRKIQAAQGEPASVEVFIEQLEQLEGRDAPAQP
jgi:Holliday junction resolvase RusA-like endonuclease